MSCMLSTFAIKALNLIIRGNFSFLSDDSNIYITSESDFDAYLFSRDHFFSHLPVYLIILLKVWRVQNDKNWGKQTLKVRFAAIWLRAGLLFDICCIVVLGFLGGFVGKEFTCTAGDPGGTALILGGKIPWRRAWQLTPSILAWRIPFDRGAW